MERALPAIPVVDLRQAQNLLRAGSPFVMHNISITTLVRILGFYRNYEARRVYIRGHREEGFGTRRDIDYYWAVDWQLLGEWMDSGTYGYDEPYMTIETAVFAPKNHAILDYTLPYEVVGGNGLFLTNIRTEHVVGYAGRGAVGNCFLTLLHKDFMIPPRELESFRQERSRKRCKAHLLTEEEAVRYGDRFSKEFLVVTTTGRIMRTRYQEAQSEDLVRTPPPIYTILCVNRNGDYDPEPPPHAHGHWVKLLAAPGSKRELNEWLEAAVAKHRQMEEGSLANWQVVYGESGQGSTLTKAKKAKRTRYNNPRMHRVFAYDLETFGTEEGPRGTYGLHQVYAACWTEVVFTRSAVYDPEKTEWSVLGEEGVDDVLDDMMSRIIEQVAPAKGYQPRVYMFAHNGGRFDSHFFFDSRFIDRPTTGDGVRVIQTPQGLLELQMSLKLDTDVYCKVRIRDSLMSVGQGSLAQLCKDFDVPQQYRKQDFAIATITRNNYRRRKGEWLPYLKNDVSALWHVVRGIETMYRSLCPQERDYVCPRVVDVYTPAGLAALYFSDPERALRFPQLDFCSAMWCRRALYGGRVQVLRKSYTHGNTEEMFGRLERMEDNFPVRDDSHADLTRAVVKKCLWEGSHLNGVGLLRHRFLIDYDATSLYPSAMAECTLHLTDPRVMAQSEICKGVEHFLRYVNSFYIFKLESVTPPPELVFPMVPSRIPKRGWSSSSSSSSSSLEDEERGEGSEDRQRRRKRGGVPGGLEYTVKPTRDNIYNSLDLSEMKRAGYRFGEIVEGVEICGRSNVLKNNIEHLFTKRKMAKDLGNKSLDKSTKLVMNSTYGKLCERDHLTTSRILSLEQAERVDRFGLHTEQSEGVPNPFSYALVGPTESKVLMEIESLGKEEPVVSRRPNWAGGEILAGARRVMNRYVDAVSGFRVPFFYYTDTDSLYAPEGLDGLWKRKGFPNPKDLGGMKNDLAVDKTKWTWTTDRRTRQRVLKKKQVKVDRKIVWGRFLGPKLKAVVTVDEDGELCVTTTSKGVNFRSMCRGDAHAIDGMSNWNPSDWRVVGAVTECFLDLEKGGTAELKKDFWNRKTVVSSLPLDEEEWLAWRESRPVSLPNKRRKAISIVRDGMSRTVREDTKKITPMDCPEPVSPRKRGLRVMEEQMGVMLPPGHDYNKRTRMY